MSRIMIAVIGDSETENQEELKFAEQVGELIAKKGYILVCGGRGGVMEAAARGAKRAGGITVGILPGYTKEEANPFIDVVILTGIGWARNQIVVLSADAVIAIGGRSGTLSEIAYAWMYNKPICAIIGFGGWSEKLAGKRIDDRRSDIIYVARTISDVARFLDTILICEEG